MKVASERPVDPHSLSMAAGGRAVVVVMLCGVGSLLLLSCVALLRSFPADWPAVVKPLVVQWGSEECEAVVPPS